MGLPRNFQAMACSLAPEPTTSTFTGMDTRSFAADLSSAPPRYLPAGVSECAGASSSSAVSTSSRPGFTLSPLRTRGRCKWRKLGYMRQLPYSHSMVPGGLLVMSYTTRFTPTTSFDDPVGYPGQDVVGEVHPVGGHGVRRCSPPGWRPRGCKSDGLPSPPRYGYLSGRRRSAIACGTG